MTVTQHDRALIGKIAKYPRYLLFHQTAFSSQRRFQISYTLRIIRVWLSGPSVTIMIAIRRKQQRFSKDRVLTRLFFNTLFRRIMYDCGVVSTGEKEDSASNTGHV